jgi:hypothetical protein
MNIILSKTIAWVIDAARTGDMRNIHNYDAKPEVKRPLGDTDVGGRQVLKFIFKSLDDSAN